MRLSRLFYSSMMGHGPIHERIGATDKKCLPYKTGQEKIVTRENSKKHT